MRRVDLNCDLGELPEMLANGSQEALLKFVTSANVACGGHAGDEEMMRTTIEQALQNGVAVGAHPGYEDRQNFGRVAMNLRMEEIRDSVYRQVAALGKIADACGAAVVHVKPHGALYNQATKDAGIARAIAEGVRMWRQDVVLVGLAGSLMLDEFRAAGFRAAAEAFADRRYEKDGSLRARKFRDALLDVPEKAAEQAVRIAEGRGVLTREDEVVVVEAQTICIHGDTPGAGRIAEAVRKALVKVGVGVWALGE
ncbi:MAG TPA: 5-oxoprolinase subunit PxpA [Candidatus Limnocylindrales bacterium]|nr:5-oxoprolinase subunit PxpA [Candidatus Limnocylindrales bacterium]